MLRIHFFAAQKVVEGTNPVPCSPHSDKLPDEALLVPGIEVFTDSNSNLGIEFGIRILNSFTLPNGIIDQNHVTLLGKALGE